MIKLRKNINKRAKKGYDMYEIININYNIIFDFRFKMRIEEELINDGFLVRVGISSIRIYW